MERYEKPIISLNEDFAEGVYAASGDIVDVGENVTGEVKCDSIYMRGVWQDQDTSQWGDTQRGYKQQFGCLGCPAYHGTGCGIASGDHYEQSGNAASYNNDNGNRMPEWERRGYGPNDVVTDWAVGG